MVFKENTFFIVKEGYLNANFSFSERKDSIFFKTFFSLIVFGLRLSKYFLRSFFVKSTTVLLCFFNFFE